MPATNLLLEIERDLNHVKAQLASLAFLVRGLQSDDGGDDLYGLGLILEDPWKALERIQERLTDFE